MDVNFVDESTYNDLADRNVLFKNRLYPLVEKGLQNKANENTLIRYISAYRDKNFEILSMPYVYKNLFFGPKDKQILFDVLNIKVEFIEELMTYIDPGTKNKKMPENVEPFTILLVTILSYYNFKKDTRYYNVFMMYYAYSRYPSLYTKYFPTPIREQTMIAALNTMSNSFYIKKSGSLDGCLKMTMEKLTETYDDRLLRFSDYDVLYVILQMKTRLNGLMNEIKNIYKNTDEKGDVVITASTFDEEGNILDLDSSLSKVTQYSNESTTRFVSSSLDYKTMDQCAKINSCSSSELRISLEILKDKNNISEIKEFYESIFYLFFTSGRTSKDVHSLTFLAVMDNIYKKGNSNDKNIIKIKSLLDKWLTDGSKSYRSSTNQGTLNNFRRAIFQYLVRIVSMSR